MNERILNTFIDYYDLFTAGKWVEGCIGISDAEEIKLLNASLASIHTIYKLLKEDIKNETV